jgi:hypothetical protein
MSTTPQTVLPAQTEGANGFATYLKVLYAPGEAFATLARVPTWGWAAIIGIVLTLVGTVLVGPATTHVAHLVQQRQFAQMSADQAAAARQAIARIPDWVYPVSGVVGALVFIWIFWLVEAVVFVVGASLSGGESKFALAWVGTANLYVIAGLGVVINGIIVAMRGVGSINSPLDVYTLPSLGMVVHGSPKFTMFLYGFNIIYLWYYIAAIVLLEQMMKMSRTAAIVTVAVLAVFLAGLAALFAK